jgi:RNA polymerase sigma-70 factor (ECF subfamily)
MMSAADNNIDSILRGIAAGNGQALAEVFLLFRPRLKKMVTLRLDRRLQGRVDPSDVLQEAYLEIARRAPERASQPASSFFVWMRLETAEKLQEVHRRHLGTQMRDAGREISLSVHSLPEASSVTLAQFLLGRLTSPSEAAQRAEMQQRLSEVLNGMEPIDLEIVALRHFEELSNNETAEVLGISPQAASNRYIRAIKRLREELTQLGGFLE